jgi:hypothetical protein
MKARLGRWQFWWRRVSEAKLEGEKMRFPLALSFFLSSEGISGGCVAKIFKLIKIDRVIAAKTHSFRENEYTFYQFYPCSIIEYISF